MRVRLFAVAVAVAVLVPVQAAQAVISGTSGADDQDRAAACVDQNAGSLRTRRTSRGRAAGRDPGVRTSLSTSPRPGTTSRREPVPAAPSPPAPSSTVTSSAPTAPNGGPPITLTGTLTFPTDILGVIVAPAARRTATLIGAPGTDYSVAGTANGLELSTTVDGVFMPDSAHGHDPRRHRPTASTRSASSPSTTARRRSSAPAVLTRQSKAAPSRCTAPSTDPEVDRVTISWTFSTAAAPGTVCTPAGTNTPFAHDHLQRRRGRHRDLERDRPVPPAGDVGRDRSRSATSRPRSAR